VIPPRKTRTIRVRDLPIGGTLADAIVILGSVDIVLGDCDR